MYMYMYTNPEFAAAQGNSQQDTIGMERRGQNTSLDGSINFFQLEQVA